MKRQLDEWNSEMDALEAKAQEAQEAAKLKYQEQLSALRTQRLAGEKKLEAVQTATEDSWERLKAERTTSGKRSKILCRRSRRTSNELAHCHLAEHLSVDHSLGEAP